MKFTSIALAALVFAATGQAHENEAKEKAEAAKNAPALATAMREASVSLASGLSASESEGTPISGKFELENGKLQLSVYTMKDGKFFEVVVDHKTGKIAKTEPITSGEDLEAAKNQAAGMAKATHSLRDVVAKAEQANAGYHAVSVTAELEGGAAEADLSLLKGAQSKHVEEKL